MADAPLPSSWCEIHLDRVSRNLELTLGLLPKGAAFCAVMKADAYGHGINRIVPLLVEQGVSCIGITSNAEARAVRDAGFSKTLIRLRAAMPQEMHAALPDHVEEQVGSLWAAKQMHALFRKESAPCGIHLALNSGGMSRDGLDVSTKIGRQGCRDILDEIGSNVVGISTHFPTNEPAPLKVSADRFQQQVAWVCGNSDLNNSDLLVHAGSTLTLLSGQPVQTDMYRCGPSSMAFSSQKSGFDRRWK